MQGINGLILTLEHIISKYIKKKKKRKTWNYMVEMLRYFIIESILFIDILLLSGHLIFIQGSLNIDATCWGNIV